MISVNEAERIVLERARGFGNETVHLQQADGRVLAEDIKIDRDSPPFNRATMDGIAIRFSDFMDGRREFAVQSEQAAGDIPAKTLAKDSCIHIMTGASVPSDADTIVPIEEVTLENNIAAITTSRITHGQYIHTKGSDIAAHSTVIAAGQTLTPTTVPVAATVGKSSVIVRRLPRVVVITTGDELVDIDTKPLAYQIRRSNNFAVQSILNQYGVTTNMLHLADDKKVMRKHLKQCLDIYDVVIVSGGVSKGKFDYIPHIMTELSVEMLFHGVKQKPGKPFWFGVHPEGTVVFALPGNPVSTFLCMYRYVLPWLRSSIGASQPAALYAVLDNDISTVPDLYTFLPVRLHSDKAGLLHAMPVNNNGSGDLINLGQADAFIELPPLKTPHQKGSVYKILAVKPIL